MSTFENRTQLWNTIAKAVEHARDDLEGLVRRHADSQRGNIIPELTALLASHGFDSETATAGLTATQRHFNAEDMRKGLQHGRVAFIVDVTTGTAVEVAAAAGAALGLSATLAGVFGEVRLVVIEQVNDLPRLCEAGLFHHPDAVFIFRATSDGSGFQHTLASSGDHLAGMMLDVDSTAGVALDTAALEEGISTLSVDLVQNERVAAMHGRISIHAPFATRVEELAVEASRSLAEHFEAVGVDLEVRAGPLIPEMLPSRVLGRRIKTFADSIGLRQDPIQKLPLETPTPWGQVSHDVPTAVVRFPIEAVLAPDVEQALLAAKAAAGAGLDVLGDMEFRGFADGERVRALRERGLARTPRRWLGVHPVLPPEDGRQRQITVPDVVVRGPGLPAPTLADLLDDEAS